MSEFSYNGIGIVWNWRFASYFYGLNDYDLWYNWSEQNLTILCRNLDKEVGIVCNWRFASKEREKKNIWLIV